MDLYMVVDCKTQNCRTVHVLLHLAKKGETRAKVEYWISYPLMIDCPTCGWTYDYSDAEETFWQKELPPPPHGYFNRLAGLRFRTNPVEKQANAISPCAHYQGAISKFRSLTSCRDGTTLYEVSGIRLHNPKNNNRK